MHLKRILILLSLISSQLHADQFHYNNFIIGNRAIGLGGAYTGVSDDASGVFYNPAGTAFATSNDISGSANAFYTRKITFKEAVADQDFKEESKGSVPSFFGGLQKLDDILPGLVFSFGIYFNNDELKDQNDVIRDVNLGSPSSPCTGTTTPRDPFILQRFHKATNERASTLNVSGALAYRLFPRVAIGFALNYIDINELIQEYQDALNLINRCPTGGGAAETRSILRTQNIRQRLLAQAIQSIFSLQVLLTEKLSWGLTFKSGTYFQQSFELNSEARSIDTDQSGQDAIDSASSRNDTANVNANIIQIIGDTEASTPLGSSPPMEIGTGLAYFYSSRLLFTFDLKYTGGISDADDIPGIGTAYNRNPVYNIAAGVEYFLIPSLVTRAGFFTNFDSRPELRENEVGQRDHVDYNGASLFLAWAQPNSQLGAGIILQQGRGKAQKVANSPLIQTVEASSFTFVFSATHRL